MTIVLFLFSTFFQRLNKGPLEHSTDTRDTATILTLVRLKTRTMYQSYGKQLACLGELRGHIYEKDTPMNFLSQTLKDWHLHGPRNRS